MIRDGLLVAGWDSLCWACEVDSAAEHVSATLQLCSACNVASYCDEVCQRQHWPQHKGRQCEDAKKYKDMNKIVIRRESMLPRHEVSCDLFTKGYLVSENDFSGTRWRFTSLSDQMRIREFIHQGLFIDTKGAWIEKLKNDKFVSAMDEMWSLFYKRSGCSTEEVRSSVAMGVSVRADDMLEVRSLHQRVCKKDQLKIATLGGDIDVGVLFHYQLPRKQRRAALTNNPDARGVCGCFCLTLARIRQLEGSHAHFVAPTEGMLRIALARLLPAGR